MDYVFPFIVPFVICTSPYSLALSHSPPLSLLYFPLLLFSPFQVLLPLSHQSSRLITKPPASIPTLIRPHFHLSLHLYLIYQANNFCLKHVSLILQIQEQLSQDFENSNCLLESHIPDFFEAENSENRGNRLELTRRHSKTGYSPIFTSIVPQLTPNQSPVSPLVLFYYL